MTTKYPTSGKLSYNEVKGLCVVAEPWWIDLGQEIAEFTVRLFLNGKLIGSIAAGLLILRPGYPNDGSSGPTDDDGNIDPVPATVHDFLYEALREPPKDSSIRKEDRSRFKAIADRLYDELLAERGMSKWWEPHVPDSWWKVWQLWRVFNPGHRTRYIGLRLIGGVACSQLRGPQYPKRSAV